MPRLSLVWLSCESWVNRVVGAEGRRNQRNPRCKREPSTPVTCGHGSEHLLTCGFTVGQPQPRRTFRGLLADSWRTPAVREASLAELGEAPERVYFDEQAEATAADADYRAVQLLPGLASGGQVWGWAR